MTLLSKCMMKNYELNVSTQNVKLQFNPLLLIGDVICSILREKKLVSDARLFSAKPALVNVQVSFVLCLYDTHFCFGNDKQTKYSYNNSTNVRDLILFFFFLFFHPLNCQIRQSVFLNGDRRRNIDLRFGGITRFTFFFEFGILQKRINCRTNRRLSFFNQFYTFLQFNQSRR